MMKMSKRLDNMIREWRRDFIECHYCHQRHLEGPSLPGGYSYPRRIMTEVKDHYWPRTFYLCPLCLCVWEKQEKIESLKKNEVDRLVAEVEQAKSLTSLLDLLPRAQAAIDRYNDILPRNWDFWLDGIHGIASIPTFGGSEPDNTGRIWSWNETHVLVGRSVNDLKIVKRERNQT